MEEHLKSIKYYLEGAKLHLGAAKETSQKGTIERVMLSAMKKTVCAYLEIIEAMLNK